MGKKHVLVKGDKFGYLTVISNKETTYKTPNGSHKRVVSCQCKCGVFLKRTVCSLVSKRSAVKSCGCYNGKKTHGGYKDRLYSCWQHMKDRSVKRLEKGESCEVFSDWLDFSKFREWSLTNGYKEDLVLCRNLDTGNYEPDNVRWDTPTNNAIELGSKHWRVLSPDGEIFNVYNMSEFCRQNGLDTGGMTRVSKGQQKSHKGWECSKIEDIL